MELGERVGLCMLFVGWIYSISQVCRLDHRYARSKHESLSTPLHDTTHEDLLEGTLTSHAKAAHMP